VRVVTSITPANEYLRALEVIFGTTDTTDAAAAPLSPAYAQHEISRIAELSNGFLPRIGAEERLRAMRHLYSRVVAHMRLAAEDPDVASGLAGAIDAVLDTLSDTEQAIVRGRFGLAGRFGPTDGRPRTFDELGDEFGITPERARSTELRAIRRLQHPNTSLRLLFDLAKEPSVASSPERTTTRSGSRRG
jgi:RNA polymerase primary sigma factor